MRDPEQLFPHDRLVAAVFNPIIPRFVKPNHITVFRFLTTPFAVFLLYFEYYAVGIPFFLFVAFTDVLDGTLARTRKQITRWGAVYDPVADKLLIGSVLLLVILRFVDFTLAMAVIFVDLITILAGVFQMGRGKVVMANRFGKTKMVLQVLGVSLVLLAIFMAFPPLLAAAHVVLVFAVIFGALSFLTYGL